MDVAAGTYVVLPKSFMIVFILKRSIVEAKIHTLLALISYNWWQFFKPLKFCQLRAIFAHLKKPLRRKIMEKPDMDVSVCQHEFWQSWGHPCWRWQQRVEVEGWLSGNSAAVTWQGHACIAQSSNPILPHYLWLMRNSDPIITKQSPDMHEVP